MYAQPKKSNNALELAEQQAEQDAHIIKQSERYAEEIGMTAWEGAW